MVMEDKRQLTFILDIDGTLCPVKAADEEYSSLIPYAEIVKKIQEYHSYGTKIVLFTSRNMNSYQGNIGKINKFTAPLLLEWLKKWNIPYDEIYYGKPWPGHYGFYVDDRAIRPSEFVKKSPAELLKICKNDVCESKSIDVVITMGGLGSRFRKAGYKKPKYMIEAKGKTLFDLSLISLDGYRSKVSQYIFIAMRDEVESVEEFITNHCYQLEIKNFKIIILDYLTDGQATTAMLASKYWNYSHELLIYNIDTYVEAGQMKWQELKGDGFIPCFNGVGDHWSFVATDAMNKALVIKEKERISDNCTLGAYYFKSCQLYSQLYTEFYSNPKNLVKGEKYVAPLYQHLVDKGGEVYISNVKSKYVHVLGTPSELDEFIK